VKIDDCGTYNITHGSDQDELQIVLHKL